MTGSCKCSALARATVGGDDAFEEALSSGRELSLEAAVAYAQSVPEKVG